MGGRTGVNCAFRSLCWVCLQNQQMMQFSLWQRPRDVAEPIPSVLITPRSRAALWNCSHWAKLLWRKTVLELRAEQVPGGFMHIAPAPELPSSQNIDWDQTEKGPSTSKSLATLNCNAPGAPREACKAGTDS